MTTSLQAFALTMTSANKPRASIVGCPLSSTGCGAIGWKGVRFFIRGRGIEYRSIRRIKPSQTGFCKASDMRFHQYAHDHLPHSWSCIALAECLRSMLPFMERRLFFMFQERCLTAVVPCSWLPRCVPDFSSGIAWSHSLTTSVAQFHFNTWKDG